MEVKADCLTVRDVATSTIAELDEALATTGPGNARLPEATATSEKVTVARFIIDPLTLVHPFLRSQFLTPVNAWNLIATRVESLGLDRRVMPLLHWTWDQTSSHTEAVDADSNQGKT